MTMPGPPGEPDVTTPLNEEFQDGPLQDISGRTLEPLDEERIKAVLQQELHDGLGGLGSEVSELRKKAIRYYYGRQFGNEIDGRSQVQLTDVKDTVEWVMPQLMRMFFGGGYFLEYEPNEEGQERFAEEATEYVNQQFFEESDGFMVGYDLMKTALLEKNSPGKVYTKVTVEPLLETYHQLSKMEAEQLVAPDGIEVVEYQVKDQAPGVDPETGEPITEQLYTVRIRRFHEKVRLCVDAIPPEEFLIARRAIHLNDDTPFTAHRKKFTVSQLISMGFPHNKVLELPSDDAPEFSVGRTERLSEDETFPVTTAERQDPASREIWTTECILRLDVDGDGFAELRRILIVGEQAVTILSNEEISYNPFFSLCPIPMPHKFFGLSLADLIMDLQLIRSTILRQMLDNMYLNNHARTVVLEDEVEMDDLLTVSPGGVIRATNLDAVKVLPVGDLGRAPMELLEYLAEVRAERTGVTRYTQGMDAASLNQTATGISRIMDASQVRIELVAKIFANEFKRMGRLLLHEMIQGPHKKRTIKLRGKWVEVDPSQWDMNMKVRVKVGLGVGQAQERIANLERIAGMQGQLNDLGMGGEMVTPRQAYNLVNEVVQSMGFPLTSKFFKDPGDWEGPEPEPDPKLVEVEQRGEIEEAKLELARAKQAFEERQAQAEMELKKVEMQASHSLEMERIRSQERIGLQKCENDAEKNRLQAKQRPSIKEVA